MQATLIENNGSKKTAYDSLFSDNPRLFSALSSDLAVKITRSLANSPASAIDVARKLKQHEQKIYYHVRRLEKAGIIYTISNERRHGMIAKIYSVVSPVISTKLYDGGIEIKEATNLNLDSRILDFLTPFISNNKLNSLIIVGDSYSHGKFDKGSDELNYAIGLLLFFGRFTDGLDNTCSKLDTKVSASDLKNNLILLGNNKTNSIIEKINSRMPIQFNNDGKELIVSKNTKETYSDPRSGVIIKTANPFDHSKKILLIGSIGRRGMQASSLVFTKYLSILTQSAKNLDDIAKVVRGFDSDGDDIIDSIKFLE